MTETLPRRPATWSGRAALINQALQDTAPMDQRIHALVDCAHRTTLFGRMSNSGVPHASLLELEEGAPPASVAPYLMELPGQHEVGMLLAEGFGQSWFSYLCSDRPLPSLVEHLRHIVRAHARAPVDRRGSRGLALWDPRVAIDWLTGLSGAQAGEFFEGIGAFYTGTRTGDGQLLRFSLRDEAVVVEELHLWSAFAAE